MPPSKNPFIQQALEMAEGKAREEKENPFLRAPKGQGKKKPKGVKKISESEWESKRAAARAYIETLGLKVGDTVTVAWEYDRAYGPGTSSFTGEIFELDDWLKARNNEARLELPLTGIKHVEITKSFLGKPEKVNPFLKGAQ